MLEFFLLFNNYYYFPVVRIFITQLRKVSFFLCMTRDTVNESARARVHDRCDRWFESRLLFIIFYYLFNFKTAQPLNACFSTRKIINFYLIK